MGLGLSLRVLAEVARVSAPMALDAARGRLDRAGVDRRAREFGERTLEALDVQLHVERQAELAGDRGYVFLFNHQSHLDIPLLFATLPVPSLRFVAKAELFRIPVWGRVLRDGEFVEVDRGDHQQAMAAMTRAAALVASGVSVAVAPEGSRSRDGRLGRLKKGGVHLAMATRAPIVPVALRGTIDILPPGARQMRAGVPVRVVIGVPRQPPDRVDAIPGALADVEAFLRRHVEAG
jgi:1-acyl-sn-glycerol-3-phosphate acyltransferase